VCLSSALFFERLLSLNRYLFESGPLDEFGLAMEFVECAIERCHCQPGVVADELLLSDTMRLQTYVRSQMLLSDIKGPQFYIQSQIYRLDNVLETARRRLELFEATEKLVPDSALRKALALGALADGVMSLNRYGKAEEYYCEYLKLLGTDSGRQRGLYRS
jgi:hypothetical protein